MTRPLHAPTRASAPKSGPELRLRAALSMDELRPWFGDGPTAREWRRTVVGALGAALLVAVGFLLSARGQLALDVALLGAGALVALGILGFPLVSHDDVLQFLADRGEVEFRIGDDGITTADDALVTTVWWPAVTDVREDERTYVVCTKRDRIVIPKRAFANPSDELTFRWHVGAHGPPTTWAHPVGDAR